MRDEKGKFVKGHQPINGTTKGKCIVCGLFFEGRKNKTVCSSQCKSKDYWLRNKEKLRLKNKKWREENKEARSKYMKEYRSTEEYRLMKQRHDKKYRGKNPKPYVPRTETQVFKSMCRDYAYKKMVKNECCLCNSKERLELHHSKGYKKESIDGVMVVCTKCHRQVIHGRGTRIKDNSGFQGTKRTV